MANRTREKHGTASLKFIFKYSVLIFDLNSHDAYNLGLRMHHNRTRIDAYNISKQIGFFSR
jgi:hypothetical protein